MTMLKNVVALCALATPLALSAQDAAPPSAEHSQHEQHAAQSGAEGNQPAAGMHEHMQAMREQMARIEATHHAGERERLLDEHMQSMQQHMRMMSSMRAEPRPMGTSRCAAGDTVCRMEQMRAEDGTARERLRSLDDRLASIEELLQQMLEHQRAEESQNAASRRERRR